MSIIAIVLIMLLGMVFCGARTIWYAAFNNKAKFDEIRQGSQSLLQEAIREPMVKIVLTMSVFAAFIVIPLHNCLFFMMKEFTSLMKEQW
jgi:hypothetical protein